MKTIQLTNDEQVELTALLLLQAKRELLVFKATGCVYSRFAALRAFQMHRKIWHTAFPGIKHLYSR